MKDYLDNSDYRFEYQRILIETPHWPTTHISLQNPDVHFNIDSHVQ